MDAARFVLLSETIKGMIRREISNNFAYRSLSIGINTIIINHVSSKL